MKAFVQDLRYGWRTLRRAPAFSTAAVLTLALGIGANVTIFSVVNAVLLRPPPVANPDELVAVALASGDARGVVFSYPDYVDYRDHGRAAADLVAFASIQVSVSGDGGPELLSGQVVSGNYFDVLGVAPRAGRTFAPGEDAIPGAHPVVVISDRLWMRRFARRRSAVGSTIVLNGVRFTVIGVAPPRFSSALPGPDSNDLWVPTMMQQVVRPPSSGRARLAGLDLLQRRTSSWLRVAGRLRPGVTAAQAETSLAGLDVGPSRTEPDREGVWRVVLTSMDDASNFRAAAIAPLRLLTVVVGLLLLIACANVGNMLLARASGRRREIGVRLAIGAGHWRVIRQLVTEGFIFASLAALAGLILAMWTSDVLERLPYLEGVQLDVDGRVLAFTVAVSLLAAALSAAAPAVQTIRADAVQLLTRGPAASHSVFSLRAGLVSSQVALSLALLVAAALFVRTLRAAGMQEVGFETRDVAVLTVHLNLGRYEPGRGAELQRRMLETAEATSGVRAATLARNVPLSGGFGTGIVLVERPGSPSVEVGDVGVNVIDRNYFAVLDRAVRAGREFAASDTASSPRVALVSESAALKLWPDGGALGAKLRRDPGDLPHEVVGIVADARERDVREAPPPSVFFSRAQAPYEASMAVLLETGGDPAAVAGLVRQRLLALDPYLPVTAVRPLREYLDGSLRDLRLLAALLSGFGGLALVLAALGLAGVVAYAVGSRTREIGIRMALGARGTDVTAMIVREAATMVGLGLTAGLGLSLLGSRVVQGMLYETRAADPRILAIVTGSLAAVALVSAYVPARRAATLSPTAALRHE
jgi:predicted permease